MQHSSRSIQTKAMAIQHLLSLAKRSHSALSTSVATQLFPLTPHVIRFNSRYSTLTDNTTIPSVPRLNVTTLPNGLRVATQSNFSSNTATVGVWIDAGSGIESLKTSGTSFFLKRMVFKGTETRSERQLKEEIVNLGGRFKAYSNREYTYYYARVMDKDVPQALDVLSDMLQNPKLEETKIEAERHEILRNMKELEEEPEEAIFDHLHAIAFPDSPLGRTVLGPAENVKTITKKDLQECMSSRYTAPRMVIAASGAVKHEVIVEHVKSMFTKLGEGSTTTTTALAAKDKTIFRPSEFRKFDDVVPLAHFAVAFNGASWTDPDLVTLMVAQQMIGDYDRSSRSAEQTSSAIVERLGKSGIAEKMTTFNCNYGDAGLFGVHAIAKPDCLDVLAHSIMYELTQLCYKVSEDDVVRARTQLKSSFVRHTYNTNDLANGIGNQLLGFGPRLSYKELWAKIDAVDVNTIKRVANRFIFDKDIAIVAIGAVQSLPNYNWFKRRNYRNKN